MLTLLLLIKVFPFHCGNTVHIHHERNCRILNTIPQFTYKNLTKNTLCYTGPYIGWVVPLLPKKKKMLLL